MNALISGRSGRALLIEGDSLKSFEVDDPSILTSRQQADLPYLFGEGADLRTLEDTTIEGVEIELRHDCNFTWALDLTLISLDAELPKEIRKEAVENLEELLATNETLAQVENILYARPLPEDADLKGTLELCESSTVVQKFLLDLEKSQPEISEVCHAWESIPTKIFGSHYDRTTFRTVAVKEGHFRLLAKVRSARSFERDSDTPRIKKLPNYKQVLRKWYELSHKPLRSKAELLREAAARTRRLRVYGRHGSPINRERILTVLQKTHGNHVLAAKLLGISPNYLRKLLSKYQHEGSEIEA